MFSYSDMPIFINILLIVETEHPVLKEIRHISCRIYDTRRYKYIFKSILGRV